jgi:multiple sugar transport system substrate-binding protein
MNRKLLALIGLTGAAAVVLAGCSSGPAADTGPVTITYTNFISQGANEGNLKKIVTAFEKANPDITVKVTTLPYTDYDTTQQTDVAAGSLSDTFDIDGASHFGPLQTNGVLAELTGVDSKIYNAGLLDAYQANGKQYALPTSFSDVVLFYNKDLFDAAGVKYPTSSWTWSDETEAAKKLTDASTGVWGDHQPVSWNEYYKALVQNGASFLNAKGTKVAFNTPAGIEAAHWLIDKSGTTMPTIADGQGTADFDTNLFKDGKLAMLHTGIWEFGAFADVPFGWDIAIEPGNKKQANAVFSNAIGVSATSKHLAAAQKWAEYMSSSDEEVNVRLDTGWELPTISDTKKLDTYLTKGKPDNRQAVFDAAKTIAPAPSIGGNQQQMQDIMNGELVEAQAGRETVEQALDNAEKKINALLAG